ncbi:hypothetical protein ABI_12190 [Asticcacaulis biprosthecium C19]|uniref:Uncharacterized protein n=1 Tax=Asticcacaulis biprosthecium C19 TaxID=715226 RepID=F4QHP4_9CAUL|nr:hypothetical protein ABI_12190 [Asticcacaulis biprosthecium C19]
MSPKKGERRTANDQRKNLDNISMDTNDIIAQLSVMVRDASRHAVMA